MLLIEQLKGQGIEFEHGLSTEEVDKIEEIYEIEFSQEFKKIYMTSFPISKGFHKWRDFSNQNIEYIKSIISRPKQWIEDHAEDVDWSDNWGEEPVDLKERIKKIKEKVKSAPKLIPIFVHRYIVSGRMEQTPVFSVHGTDIIYYGENLEQYLEIEFEMKSYDEMQYDKIREVPFWSDIL